MAVEWMMTCGERESETCALMLSKRPEQKDVKRDFMNVYDAQMGKKKTEERKKSRGDNLII